MEIIEDRNESATKKNLNAFIQHGVFDVFKYWKYILFTLIEVRVESQSLPPVKRNFCSCGGGQESSVTLMAQVHVQKIGNLS